MHRTDNVKDMGTTKALQADLDDVCDAGLLDDAIREAVHADLAPCTAEEWIAEYARRVGPDAIRELREQWPHESRDEFDAAVEG